VLHERLTENYQHCPEFIKTQCDKISVCYRSKKNPDGNNSRPMCVPVGDATAARSREVLVVRTLCILDGDGCSALLLLPLPLLSSPFLTGVVAVLRVMKRRCGVMEALPGSSREPY
jgi:hypothetical protein